MELALLGGEKKIDAVNMDIFHWPVVTERDEEAVLSVLRAGSMSGLDQTRAFESEFAEWHGRAYGVGFHNGTAALQAAMWGCHVGVGDEIICPSVTYWASAMPAYSLGATVVFADCDPITMCVDPASVRRMISPKTKAIVAVHLGGHPAEMDELTAIAEEHDIPIIEDVSHAHGGLYRRRQVGTFGRVAAFSLMGGKPLAAGEMGVFVTDDREVRDRAIAFGQYIRYNEKEIDTDYLREWQGLPLGGYKYRVNQLSSALARTQLAEYDRRMSDIQQAMNYFWDRIEEVPGLKGHRPDPESGSTMGGWYSPMGHYDSDALGGLSVTRFAEAVRAEGSICTPGGYKPLHLHPVFNSVDVYGHGKPTRIANADRDVRQPRGSLPVSESINARVVKVPWFKHPDRAEIDRHVEAYHKVMRGYQDLLEGDPGNQGDVGAWSAYHRS
jgi:dTDP-4-amino-4,6-dideoxygalactose transaminase